MSNLVLQDVKLYYETYAAKDDSANENSSQKKWITLINGHTRSSRDFKLLAHHLKERGFNVLTFDNRGSSGKTEFFTSNFTFNDMVRDVIALWDHLGIKKSAVAGLSMGGFIAQGLVSQQLGRVESLCLICTSSRLKSKYLSDGVLQGKWGSDEQGVLKRLEDLYFHPKYCQKNPLILKSMAKKIAEENSLEAGEKNSLFDERARLQTEAIKTADEASIKNSLSHLDIPCLIAHGDSDRLLPFKEAEILHDLIPQSKLHCFKETGHLVLAERGRELYELISDLLTKANQKQL
ncbi:MAG: alpha/beta fold hydrolase [Oligoflexales bacterium]|nr:alpha/beta fold hydrolase [Oligoflexales bacterium]